MGVGFASGDVDEVYVGVDGGCSFDGWCVVVCTFPSMGVVEGARRRLSLVGVCGLFSQL